MKDQIVERYTETDGTKWIRVWRLERPGMLHLIWEIER